MSRKDVLTFNRHHHVFWDGVLIGYIEKQHYHRLWHYVPRTNPDTPDEFKKPIRRGYLAGVKEILFIRCQAYFDRVVRDAMTKLGNEPEE